MIITLGIDNLENYVKNHCKIMESTYLPENISFELFKYLNFTYRECNKYMSMYRIVEPYTDFRDSLGKKSFLFEADVLLPISIALKIKNIEEYNSFVTGAGEEIIKSFLAFLEAEEGDHDYINWLSEILLLKDDESLEKCFIQKYKEVFANNKVYYSFPYFEAISMLGNSIDFGDNSK